MIYIGIDPSFTGTGFAWYDSLCNGVIHTKKFSTEMGGKRFVDIAKAADDITTQVTKVVNNLIMNSLNTEKVKIISENPPPMGQFASGLYGLDVHLLNELSGFLDVEGICVVNPNYLQHLHGKRKYTKGESVKLFQNWCDKLKLTILPEKRLSSDEAEAGLFLLRLLSRNGVFKGVFDVIPALKDQKEVMLYGKA